MTHKLMNKTFDNELIRELKDWQDILAVAKANMENPVDEHDYHIARLEYDSAIDRLEELQLVIAH